MAKANKTQEQLFQLIGELEQKLESVEEMKMVQHDRCELRYLDGVGRTLVETIKDLRKLI
jgi:hypothetical protein